MATARRVAVLNAGHLQKLLGGRGRDNTGTARGGNQAHTDGTATASDLHGHGVGGTELVTPVATTDGDDGKLGLDHGTADGGGHFLAALDTETQVTVAITDGNEGLEAGTLTGSGLLLHGHDLQHFIVQGGQEVVDDLALLDGQSVQVQLLDGLDLVLLYKAAKLGDGNPFLGFAIGATATTATTSTTASTATSMERKEKMRMKNGKGSQGGSQMPMAISNARG